LPLEKREDIKKKVWYNNESRPDGITGGKEKTD